MKTKDKIFEEAVRELLRLGNWTVTDERLIGHKRADCVASRKYKFNQESRMAVECKCLSRKIGLTQAVKVYLDYKPLVDNNLVHFTLLVTENGLTSKAEAYIDSLDNFEHRTRQELENDLLDFSAYVRGLFLDFTSSEISNFYVPQKIENRLETVQDFILNDIEANNNKPLAVLAGYGMGKSTLAKVLASKLAESHIEDFTKRIPILINLESLIDEISIDGLICRKFSSETVIDNFNYPLFSTLNNKGRFIFLLDGFDEMKRVMPWETLLRNLKEIFKLITPDSKVVIFGRPSAFLNQDEQDEALHGKVSKRGKLKRVSSTVVYNFTELYLSSFSHNDVVAVINGFRESSNSLKLKIQLDEFLQALKEHDSKVLKLAERPVQLKMLIDILPSFDGKLDELSVTELYLSFIEMVMDRELEKESNQRFSLKQRMNFIQRLAYYMWQNSQSREIFSHQIPDDLLCKYDEDIYTSDAIKRDLLTGSLLERKGDSGFYFPHRSFHEFLVADHLYNMTKNKDAEIFKIPYLTPETQAFFIDLVGMAGARTLNTWVMKIAKDKHGEKWARVGNPAFEELLKIICEFYNIRRPIRPESYKKTGLTKKQKKFKKSKNNSVTKSEVTRILSTNILKPISQIKAVKVHRNAKNKNKYDNSKGNMSKR